MKKNGVRCRSLSLSNKDIEKIDRISGAEQIQSRSEVIRRLIDREYLRVVSNEERQ